MNFLNNIEKETLLIVPSQIKEKVLNEINKLDKLINIKIMSFEELKRNIYFDYNEEAILYLMEKYNYKYEVAKNYIENIYYLSDKEYKDKKLMFLKELKKELEKEKLLEYNNLFLNAYENKNVIVYGYDYVNKFNQRILTNFSNVKIITKEELAQKYQVYEFETLDDEILFVLEKIIELINNNVDLNNIKIVNLDDDYKNQIIKIFNLHNIPIDLDKTSNIGTTILIKDALTILKETKSFEETINNIKNKYDLTNEFNASLYANLINLFNKYIGIDRNIEKIIEAIEYDIKNTNINKNNLKNYIRVSDLNNNVFLENEYVFLLGFNQGKVPKIYKDEEYITDNIKDEVDIEKVTELNKIERKTTLTNIKSIKNLTISYKLKNKEDEFYPSNLLDEEIFEKHKTTINKKISYSKDYSEIVLATMIDDLIKYGEKDENLEIYFSTLKIPYLKYDNKYTKIDNKKLKEYLNNKLVLSYSNLDTYYKCSFRYYLDNILKVNKYEETFNTFIGSLFHFVLSKIYNDNFDMDREYDYYIKDKTFTNKEKFFVEKLRKELKIICERIKEFNKMTGLTKAFTEKVISVDKSTDIEVIFKGIVDKIMYKEYDGENNIAIIDYKTGNTDIDIYNAKYGIGMQLIIYLYLISKSNLFDSYNFVGFYLQKILNSEVNIEEGKTYLELKYNNLKLYGYSTDDTLALERFDNTYENSEYIVSMKYGKTGFSRYAKILTNDEMQGLINVVDKKIELARDNILDSNFQINPKKLSNDKEITGCKFCHYKDICFRKNEDVINIVKQTDLSFLKEGEENA